MTTENRPHVLLSFLGLGSPLFGPDRSADPTDYVYKQTVYFLHEGGAEHTGRYVQAALAHLEGQLGVQYDRVLLAMTPASRRWHWDRADRLKSELPDWARDRVQELDISDALSVEAQWANFGKILDAVPHGATLSVDLTHGFRAIPILFSVAIDLLTRVKHVHLRAAYYAAYEQGKTGPFPIIEMSTFFGVTRWAEAVRAVTEDANPALLSQLARSPGALHVPALADTELVDSLDDLALVIKSADSVAVAPATERVVKVVTRLRATPDPMADALLGLLEDKFGEMIIAESLQRFTSPWYQTQLQFAKTLIGHGLAMQGLTVLQELSISWCEEVCAHELRNVNNPARQQYLNAKGMKRFKKKLEKQRGFGDSLRARLWVEEEDWDPTKTGFDETGELVRGIVDPVFEAHFKGLRAGGAFAFFKPMGDLRNAFNHAWVGRKPLPKAQLLQQVDAYLTAMTDLTGQLLERSVIGRGEP